MLWTEESRREGIAWLTVVIALTLAPDIDTLLPVVVHRGVTHTVLAALFVGVALATVGWTTAIGSVTTRTKRALYGFIVGAGAFVSHLLGDVITPMGIRPLFPLENTEYTLNLVLARNPQANTALLILGIASLLASYYGGRPASTTDSDTPDDDVDDAALTAD